MKSLIKKAKTILDVGLEPYEVGKHNFENPIICVEVKAEERAEICKTCVFFVDEPIDFLKVKDERIPIISEKMCGECGCTLPYKIRQSIKPCEKWLKQKENL